MPSSNVLLNRFSHTSVVPTDARSLCVMHRSESLHVYESCQSLGLSNMVFLVHAAVPGMFIRTYKPPKESRIVQVHTFRRECKYDIYARSGDRASNADCVHQAFAENAAPLLFGCTLLGTMQLQTMRTSHADISSHGRTRSFASRS